MMIVHDHVTNIQIERLRFVPHSLIGPQKEIEVYKLWNESYSGRIGDIRFIHIGVS